MSIYLSYDDDTLATFANMGLVRRAKKTIDDVVCVDIDTMTFETESFVVQLSNDGIQKATCTCPSHECCKHILASILFFQKNYANLDTKDNNKDNDKDNNNTKKDNTDNNTKNSKPKQKTTDKKTPTESLSALQDLLTLDPILLQKSVKKSERILAHTLYDDLIKDNVVSVIETNNKLTITLTHLDTSVYYFNGLSLSGMVSQLPDKQKTAYHLAIIASLFTMNNAPWQWTDDVNIVIQASFELSDDELAFIKELKQLCINFLKQGISHIAKESVLSLHLFNLQARTHQMPRLAGIIRRVYGAMMDLLTDDIHIKESMIFDELAFLYHYLQSFINSHHAKNQEQIDKLRGKVIKDYDEIGINKLIPLGGTWWQNKTGARGVDFCFWDCDNNELKSVTNGRANALDTTFTSHSAYQTGIWGASIDYLSRHIISLTHAKIADNGTLSPSELTRYRELGELKSLSVQAFLDNAKGIDDWQEIIGLIRPDSRLFLTYPNYLLLHPSDVSEIELDEINQQFFCQISDKNNRQLTLTLPVSPLFEKRLKNFGFWAKFHQIVSILTKVQIQDNEASFLPVALIISEPSGIYVFNLDFDYVPYAKQKQKYLDNLSGRIANLLAQKQKSRHTPINSDNLTIAVNQTLSIINFYANTGRHISQDDKDTLTSLGVYFYNMGIDIIHHAIKDMCQHDGNKDRLLRLRYLIGLLQLQRLALPIVDGESDYESD